MAPPTYLGRHAVLHPGDFIILVLPPETLPEGWKHIHGIAYKHVTGDEAYQSLGLHRSAYAFAFSGIAGIDHFAGESVTKSVPTSSEPKA